MPLYGSDKLLLIATCFGLCASYFLVPKLLQESKDETLSPSPDSSNKDKRLDRDTEIEVKLDTLGTLAEGHVLELRNSAIKIIASRTVKSSTRKLLLRDLTSNDEDTRNNAINSLWLLIYIPDAMDREIQFYFVDYDSFYALITALVNLLSLHKPSKDEKNEQANSTTALPPSPVRPTYRPAHEVSLMVMLTYLLHYCKQGPLFDRKTQQGNLATALSAGLVSRWLTDYPFPCALPENSGFNFKKHDVMSLFDREVWGNDDPLMLEIMKILTRSAYGVKQLREAGLAPHRRPAYLESETLERSNWGRRYHIEESSYTTSEVIRMPPEDEQDAPRPRSAERSQEEESLRRRHREAIVVAERGVPLSRENILQRENSRVALAPLPTNSDEELILQLEASAFEVEESSPENIT